MRQETLMETIRIVQGADRSLKLPNMDSNGAPLDITWWGFLFTVKKKEDIAVDNNTDSNAVIKKYGTIVGDPLEWIGAINLVKSDTAKVTPWEYYYNIVYINGAGDHLPSEPWLFIILPNLTQRDA